ncbi:MAG: DUF523 domain-containing protein [Planctomycetota bacterium]|nr:DUF523 domain-containing protein [Planctomycetota bacterium]
MNERVLVSACLLGRECRHDGRAKTDHVLQRELVANNFVAVPFCPEEHGGLGTPRPSAWIERESADAVLDGRDRVVTSDGSDVTRAFVSGAEGAHTLCRLHDLKRAYLKSRSPSCGVDDTHVAGTAVAGPGVTSALLRRHGIELTSIEGLRD